MRAYAAGIIAAGDALAATARIACGIRRNTLPREDEHNLCAGRCGDLSINKNPYLLRMEGIGARVV